MSTYLPFGALATSNISVWNDCLVVSEFTLELEVTRTFHLNCGEIVLWFENIAMKRVINCRKARYFGMDIEWFTFSDRGVYADGRHFCLGYLNIFHRNEYLRVHKLISLDQSRFFDNIKLSWGNLDWLFRAPPRASAAPSCRRRSKFLLSSLP